MHEVEQLCISCGVGDVYLNTSDQMAFYAACGYAFLQPVDKPPEKFGLVGANLRNALGGTDEGAGKIWMKKRVKE